MDHTRTLYFGVIICFISGTECILSTDKPKNEDAVVTESAEGENESSTCSSSDFAYVRKHSTAFVDKTLSIEKLRHHGRIILTAPRQFGKIINLSMLKYFYEIEVSKETGEPVTKSDIHKNPVTDTENYKLFQNLAINRQRPDFTKEQFGRYPVILLDFSLKTIVKLNSDEAVLNHYKAAIHQAYKQHWYLMNSTKLTDSERKMCQKWCDENEYLNITISDYFIGKPISNLLGYLNKHFNKMVIVLVDEYDALNRATSGDSYELRKNCSKLYDKIFYDIYFYDNFCFGHEIKHFVLTGVSHLAMENTRLEIFPVYRFLRNEGWFEFKGLFDFHGFTQKEFDWLMKKHKISADMKEKAARYYDGYCSLDGKKHLYNPSSTVRFLKTKILKAYFSSTKFFEKYGNLMDSITVESWIKKLLFGVRLPYILIGNYSGSFNGPTDHFPTYFFEEGFLTTAKHDDYRYRRRNDDYEHQIIAELANEEIRISIVSELRKYYKTSGHFDWESMKSCGEYFDNINFTDEKACAENLLKIYTSMGTYVKKYYSKYPKYMREEEFTQCLSYMMASSSHRELYLRLLLYNVLELTKYKIRIEKPLANKNTADIFMSSDKGCIMIQVKFLGFSQHAGEALNHLVKNQLQNETTKCILIGMEENREDEFNMSATINHREYFNFPDICVKKSFAN